MKLEPLNKSTKNSNKKFLIPTPKLKDLESHIKKHDKFLES